MQRLLTISSDGSKKAKQLSDQYLPAADFNVVIVNATTYGGSGGDVCVASLNNESLEMMLHELGHTTAKLSDEYFAGASYAAEMPNMTAESDPAKVRWSRFIGKNGVGVYEYDNGGNGWYRPHQNCKMRFLGKQYAFCEVCKEQIRKTFCQDSNVTKNININKSTNGKASNKAAARTGDQSPVWMYTLLSLAALAVIAAVICKRRFRR